ncbi:TPT-domain-containing protein [Conidiobolus coronatus NRRL 28638]|uniref:TPT-domain-containing protein n=1 Tax=Conidiobolus coronatus (strain ATCC 28846 / CBS 209.66 / NRRL 28638) TaxID=796925 RepID=A0A137P6W2_CONC2|nr:TPT-domain-containing protein [Conidiobolus coronatus NRRL 28638]|eukprot:KXN70735.1 TPT-domain-containing protein [Conidiobolus coronatus NRRL 28638]
MRENPNRNSIDNDDFYNDIEEQELIERGDYEDLNKNHSQNSTEKATNSFTVALVILFFGIISISVVYLNKLITKPGLYGFEYPFTVTLFQFFVALVLIFVFGELNKRATQKSSWNPIPPFEFKLSIAKKVAPLTLIYVGMIGLSNYCLTYSDITYYQVAKSLTIIFTIFFTYLILNKSHSGPVILTCIIIIIGYILGNLKKNEFSLGALVSGLVSSIFTALYGIYIKKTLKHLNDDEWTLLIYNTTIAIFILFPICLITGEFYTAWTKYQLLSDFGFWMLMIIAGVAGFLINIAVFLAVKLTSPLTFTVAGTAKAGIQAALAPLIFSEKVSFMEGLGITIVLAGSSFYSYIKYKESNQKK